LSEAVGEAELARRARAGDAASFVTLCGRHQARVWRIAASVARGADLEDLAQEAIVRAYCSLASYRAEAPFEAWLCRIALNAAHDYQRSAWRRRVQLAEEVAGEEAGASPEGEVERRELQRRVRQAVAALPESQRGPIWLHYFEGFSLAEVARLEGVPEATLRSRVRAGLRRLSTSLADLLTAPEERPLPLGGEPRNCEA
jgi:RNA polymerase sigma-70 factor, ECF subfamily